MVLVLRCVGGKGGVVRDLWRFTLRFSLSLSASLCLSIREKAAPNLHTGYERRFHTGTLPGNRKDSCL